MKRRVRLGAKARRRVRAGGKLAQGRPSVSRAVWLLIQQAVTRRSGGWCEAHTQWVKSPFGPPVFEGLHGAKEFHHVVKRSAGGADHPNNIVHLCRAAHRQTDAAYAKGRLVITPLDHGRFEFRVVFAADKFAARGQG